MVSPLFRCKGIDQLLSDSENAEVRLKKTLGWVSLTSLGIGAVIILITFVWTTYDDKTFRLLDAKNTRSADVPQSIDAGAPRSRETGSGQLLGSPKKM